VTETVNFSPLTFNGLPTSFHTSDVEGSRLLNSRRFEERNAFIFEVLGVTEERFLPELNA